MYFFLKLNCVLASFSFRVVLITSSFCSPFSAHVRSSLRKNVAEARLVRVLCCASGLKYHSGVELRRAGLCGTVGADASVTSTVVTPIFFRERSSVTEMERKNAGREGTWEPETETHIFFTFMTEHVHFTLCLWIRLKNQTWWKEETLQNKKKRMPPLGF